MKGKRILVILVTLALALGATLSTRLIAAQEPPPRASLRAGDALGTAFTYQGRLTDTAGPVDATCDFTFKLFDAPGTGVPPEGGTELGSLPRTVQVGDGLFLVQLDFGPDAFSGDRRWLHIDLDCGGGVVTLDTRQELTPAPYALYSTVAGRAPWSGLEGVPEGFADGVDDDTTYTPGDGLMLVDDVTFSVDLDNITAGTLPTARYSAYADLAAEGYLDDNAASDLLTRSQADGRYVEEGQVDSVTSAMIVNDTVAPGDLRDGAALAEIVDDDGASSGLDADLLDGQHASAFALDGHDHDADYWAIGGNTLGATGVLGTSDNYALDVRVNGARALRLEPNASSPNLLGGHSANAVTAGAYGTAIGGGGNSTFPNLVTDNYSTVAGGGNNLAGDNAYSTSNAQAATVGGGWGNQATDQYDTVAGGSSNHADGGHAFVGGGNSNDANGTYSVIAGGYNNSTSSLGSNTTIGGGYNNSTGFGSSATVGGGEWNAANGEDATVPGGNHNTAAGDYGFAAGRQAKANSDGCFVWGDSTASDVACDTADRTIFRASGGFYVYTSSDLSTGMYLAAGSPGPWQPIPAPSDRNLKEGVEPVDTAAVLERLVTAVPITTWNYASAGPSIRHMGPMAQDFYAAFGLGEDDLHISPVDANGVALTAIQGLYAQNQAFRAENAAQQQQIDALQQQTAALQARLAALERQAVAASSSRSGLPAGWLLLGGLVACAGVVVQRRLPGGGR
jgi:hypothetical protein